jgi:nitroreductase
VTPTGQPVGDDPAGGRPTFDQVLASRRMCRDFLSDELPDDLLDRVLRAAFRGPSAGNAAALELVVLTGGDTAGYWDTTLDASRRASFPWPGLLCAPVLVLPYVAPARYVERYAEADKAASGLGERLEDWPVPYWWVDGGAGVMALLLAAEAEGLGALFFGQFAHEPAVAARLGVPADRRSLGTVALGVPAGERRGSVSSRRGRPEATSLIHRGGWGTAD